MYIYMYVCVSADCVVIEKRKREISELWSSLRESIDLRSLSLAVAREIHTFDRDATDTKERVQVCVCVCVGRCGCGCV